MIEAVILNKLKAYISSKFPEKLTYRFYDRDTKPFLQISHLEYQELVYVPSFHLVAIPHENQNQFLFKLLSFHGKILEESLFDEVDSDFDKFTLLQDYATDKLLLCHGRLKHTCDIAVLNREFLVEHLEENVVVRSEKCSYVFRKSSLANNLLCDYCTNLDGCVTNGNIDNDFNADQNYLTDENSDTFELLRSSETPSQLNSKPTAAFLQKLKSLNLPVTVSITAAPITPTKKPEPKNVAASNKSSQKLCAISTVISSTTKNKNVIEIMGNTVTNTCRWCGQVFHRLYLFKNHLKVCEKAPKPVPKPVKSRRLKTKLSELDNLTGKPADLNNDTTISAVSVDLQTFKEKCKICLHVYNNKSRFIQDMQQHRKQLKIDLDSPVMCPICQEHVQKRTLLNDHYSSRHMDPDNDAICCQCFQVMPASKLKSHLYYKQQADKRHLCPLCGKSLSSTYQLEVHMAVHHKGEVDPISGGEAKSGTSALAADVMCDQCGKVFAHRALLNVHIRKQHAVGGKVYTCEFCSKNFNSPRALQEHLGSVHLNLKPFKCKECDYSTSHKNNIYKHFQQHHGRKGNSDDVDTIN